MLCALTVRTLKPGTFDEFREAFMREEAWNQPEGWVRSNMLRNVEKPDEVICFRFFDGTVEELRHRLSAAAPSVSA
jgi:heme-degrading monooxygenase HmoA